jgi:thiamine biosynthesis protein ThiS
VNLIINGEARQVAEGLSLTELVQQLGMQSGRVAVELEREIVPRDRWSQTILKEGDRLEIVHFVGGGRE